MQKTRDNITGKDILLVIEPFYGYGELIEKELLKLGAKSVCRKVAAFFSTDLTMIRPLRNILAYRHYYARRRWTEAFKQEIAHKHFDVLFVVENMTFTKDFISYIDNLNPGIRKILFLWDTFRTQQSENIDFLPLFDTVYTFDRDDAQKYGLHYFPDFYIDVPLTAYSDCKYDLSFFASAQFKNGVHRITLASKIFAICKENRFRANLYLKYVANSEPANTLKSLIYRIKYHRYETLIKKHLGDGFLYTDSKPIQECNLVFANSKAILDISHPNRQGLTINAITAIALGKKLITTNCRIKEESFYDPENILVISEQNPVIPSDFLIKHPRIVDLSYLRLDNWLKHIVNENE